MSNNTNDDRELIILAYQAVTMTYPTKEIVEMFNDCGIKRTLEILFVFRQSTTNIKNTKGFIKQAISNNWKPTILNEPIPKNNNNNRGLPQWVANQSNNRSAFGEENEIDCVSKKEIESLLKQLNEIK